MNKEGMKCDCRHHKVVPFMIVLIALTFLLDAMGVISSGFASIAWPIFLGVAGFSKMKENRCTCC